MPHSVVNLIPGVDQNRTPTLNEAGVSYCNLIRYFQDKQGQHFIQKLGGWTKFFSSAITSPIRCLLGWEDLNKNAWLAVGAEQELSVIANSAKTDLTPHTFVSNSTLNLTTNAGDSQVGIIDSNGVVTSEFDAVYLMTPISIGGIILSGPYKTIPTRDVPYFINSEDIYGNPVPALNSISGGGVVPAFSSTIGSPIITVTFPNHGLSNGQNTSFLVPTTFGGVTIYGIYKVQDVTDANTYTILASMAATSTVSNSYMNGGLAQYVYYLTFGPVSSFGPYGSGIYGDGLYGIGSTQPPTVGAPITCTDWTLGNFGAFLIASPETDTNTGPYVQTGGAIYYWDPGNLSIGPQVIVGAPFFNDGFFIAMPQRQIIAWGSEELGIQDPLLIRWCDVNDFTSWIAQPTNQAGSYRISEGSKIVAATQGPQQGIIWTDISVWSMQYIGQPDIYSFNKISNGGGMLSRKASGSLYGVIYWLSQNQVMYMAPGGKPEILPCSVWDVIFQELDFDHLDKVRFAANSYFSEIAWYIPTNGSNGAITSYAKFNVALNTWDFGSLNRTAWIDQSVLGAPIGASALAPGVNYIYQHETSLNADGLPMDSWFQTGYYAMSEGDYYVTVDQFWPDFKYGLYNSAQTANAYVQFILAEYPTDVGIVTNPFLANYLTKYFTPNVRSRLTALKMGSIDLNSFWRVGRCRYRGQPDGEY